MNVKFDMVRLDRDVHRLDNKQLVVINGLFLATYVIVVAVQLLLESGN